MSALSPELFTWKSPSGASLTHPHDPRQQNMECISNPAQKYEYESGGFYWEYLMCNGSVFFLFFFPCGCAAALVCSERFCGSCCFLSFQRQTLYRESQKKKNIYISSVVCSHHKKLKSSIYLCFALIYLYISIVAAFVQSDSVTLNFLFAT